MIANTPEAWSERAKLHTSWDAAMWSPDGQQQRFRSVLEAVAPQRGETLLDYGCGTGALAEELPAGVQYLGYDWATGMIARAERDHPYHSFTSVDPKATFDLIVCVGPFNLPDGWSHVATWATLMCLWKQTRRALAACFYSGTDPSCLSYTEEEVERGGRELGLATVVRHRVNDLLLVVSR